VASRNDQDSGGVLSARGGEANADTVKQPFEATEVESGAEPALEIDSVPESTPEIPDVPDAPLPSDVDTLDSGETEAAESAPESPEEDEERPEDAPSRVARAVDPEQPAPRDERLEASGAGDVSGVIEQGETLTLPFEESPEESVEEELDEEGGKARIHSTTPFNKDLERGVIIGGMTAPGDLDYIDVKNDKNPQIFVIEFA